MKEFIKSLFAFILLATLICLFIYLTKIVYFYDVKYIDMLKTILISGFVIFIKTVFISLIVIFIFNKYIKKATRSTMGIKW